MNGIKRYGFQGLKTVGTWPHEIYPKRGKCHCCGDQTPVELYQDSRQGSHHMLLCSSCVTAWRAYRKGFSRA